MKEALLISPSDVMENFHTIRKYIEMGHKTGTNETSLESLMGKALAGTIQVWVSLDEESRIKCVGTTEIMQYAEYKALHLITLGGESGQVDLVSLHKPIEDFARKCDCSCIIFWGRKAWERASVDLEGKHGETYKETYRVYSMELK